MVEPVVNLEGLFHPGQAVLCDHVPCARRPTGKSKSSAIQEVAKCRILFFIYFSFIILLIV